MADKMLRGPNVYDHPTRARKQSQPTSGDARPKNQGRKPSPVDVHVAGKVRLRRMVIGMSQTKLGERIGLTFQQIQKYENGTNRIGASKLSQLSRALGVPVQFFFDDAPLEGGHACDGFEAPKTEPCLLDSVKSHDGLELNKAFIKITDPRIRKRVIEIVRLLSDDVTIEDALDD